MSRWLGSSELQPQKAANALPQKSGPSRGGQAGAVVLMRQFWATGARINAPGDLPFLCACVGQGPAGRLFLSAGTA